MRDISSGGLVGREERIRSWYFGIMDLTNLMRTNLLVGGGRSGSETSKTTEKMPWSRLYLRGVLRSIWADLSLWA